MLAGLTALLAAQAPKMNVKMGLWEMTSTMQMGGDMPGMPDTSKMTPEQQAQVKAAMAAMAKGMTNTTKSCLTKEKFENGELMADKEHNCKHTVLTNNATAYDVKVECTENAKTTTNGTYHFEAPTPETVRGKIDATSVSDGKTMKVAGTITGKWLGADCGDIK
jgi:hypothetical protein